MLKEVCQGAENCELVKKYNVSKSTISTILKNKEKITSSAANSTNRKHLQKITYADVEDALPKWFTDARARNIPISWLMMLGKARNFAFLLDRPGFCPGNGWLHLFKDNVVPAEAHAYINHRVHPSQSVAEVVELDRQLLGGLPNVSLEVLHSMEAHPVSPHSEQELGFRAIACSVRKIFPEAISVPALALGNTDTRYYLDLTRNVYRFAPVLLTPQEASSRLHGDNERISRLNYERLVNFYRLIMRYADHAGISHQSRDEL
nr:N-fatty-acyl-amino acid synthase/hydrolase PM20D1.2-like [Dermacentor andersoni]